jgi:hypothetical protein
MSDKLRQIEDVQRSLINATSIAEDTNMHVAVILRTKTVVNNRANRACVRSMSISTAIDRGLEDVTP